jgi:hypothetical protein
VISAKEIGLNLGIGRGAERLSDYGRGGGKNESARA